MRKAKFWLPLPRYFMATGRISRLQYLVHSLILFVVFVVLSLVGTGLGSSFNGRGHLLAMTFTTVVTSYLYLCLDAKRVHDLNWPAIVVAIMLVEPVIIVVMNLVFSYAEFHPRGVTEIMHILHPLWRIASGIVGLILLFAPGNRGDNKYGPDPLRPPSPQIDVF